MYTIDTFRGFADTQPLPDSLGHMVELARTDQTLQLTTLGHRRARDAGDKKLASQLKSSVRCFAVAVRFSGGKSEGHITGYTGLTLVDLDGIAPERMDAVVATVKADPHTHVAYITLSGHGLRIIARYEAPLSSPQKGDSYKAAFQAVNEYYRRLTGVEPDLKCSNATRLSALAHDPDAYYNPDAEPFDTAALAAQYRVERRPVGRPRKGQSGAVSADSCEATVLGGLERRGVRYEPGNHNRYISDACYEMNRLGVPEEDCIRWAVERFADYAATDDVPAIVRSCYRHTGEHGTRQPHRTGRGESKVASAHAIAQWLDGQHISTRYNVLTRKHEVQNQPEATFVELTDRILNTICCDINRALPCRVLKSDLIMVVESDRSPEYNPLLEYLDSLPQWDGTGDPIAELASMVTTSNDAAELHCRFFKKWLVGLVACWLDPMVTNHVILAYIGR